MGSQNTVCFLCQHALRVSKGPKLTRRYSSFRQRSREPYILPRLVIDLDSADNKYVRPAEDGETFIHNEPEPKSDDNKMKSKRERSIQLTNWHNSGPLDTRTTTPLDILNYVLEGNLQETTKSITSSALHDSFRQRRIQRPEIVEGKMGKLLHGFSADEPLNLRAAGFGGGNDEAIVRQIRERYTSFRKFSRAISMLSSTTDGCRFLSANGAAVVAGIKLCRENRRLVPGFEIEANLPAIIRLLNNLHLNMKSKGVDIGSDLCNAGLFYSTMAFELQALRMYIQIMAENGYPTDRYTCKALSQLLSMQLGSPKTAQTQQDRPAADTGQRRAVLRLLTGCETDSAFLPIEQRQPSFASLLQQDHNRDFNINLYPAYILTLGKMGQRKALLQELATIQDSHLPKILRGEVNITRKACVLAMGFVVAKDLENAAAVLKAGFKQSSHKGEGDVMWPVVMLLYNSHSIQVTPGFIRILKGFVGHDWPNALDLIQRFVDYEGLLVDRAATTQRPFADWVEDHNGTGRAIVNGPDHS